MAHSEAEPQVARRQAGVFTAAQAVDEGWTMRQVSRRLASGRWQYVAGAALARPGAAWTPLQFATAARLTWPECVVSHQTAGLLHGFPLHLVPGADVITWRGRRSRRLLRAHVVPVLDEQMTTVGDVPVTDAVRSALDCLATLPMPQALDLWAWLSTRQVLHCSDLHAAATNRHRWHGTPQLRAIAELVAGGAVSGAELRFHELLRSAGLAGWTAGAQVRDAHGLVGVVDVLFAEAMIVVEIDGFRAHISTGAFERDRRRQNRLVMAGYLVLRFTWEDLNRRPGVVLAQIRDALRARGATPTKRFYPSS